MTTLTVALGLIACFLSHAESKENTFLVKTKDNNEESEPLINHVAGDDYSVRWRGFQDVLELLPKEQYTWFKSLDRKQKKFVRKIISDEFKYDKKVVDRHCLPYSNLLKAARNGKFEKIVKSKIEKLKKSKGVSTRMLDLIVNILPGICFSGASTVQTRRGLLHINQLRLGDSVLTYSHGEGLLYTEFLGWLDRSIDGSAPFLKVSTTNGSITLSANHVIFRLSKTGVMESVYAGQLQEGDILLKVRGKKERLVGDEVVAVERKLESGFWAPLTKEGTLLVDGFLASCYASFPHHPSQIAFALVKMFPRQLLDDESSQHKDGVRRVVKAIKTIGEMVGLRRNVTDENDKAQLGRPSWPEGNLIEAEISAFVKNTEF